MAKESNRKMTLEEAREILGGHVFAASFSKIEEAKRIIRENNPNDPLLKQFAQKEELFEKENNLAETDSSVYEQNLSSLDSISTAYTFEKFMQSKDNKDLIKLTDRIQLLENKGSSEQKITDQKSKDSYLNLLFEGAKLKAETYLAGKPDLQGKDAASKAHAGKVFRDEVRNIFFADFAQSAIASKLEKPLSKEQRLGSVAYRAYIKRQTDLAAKTFEQILNSGATISVKTDSILSSCADTAVRVENYVKALRNKAEQNFLKIAENTKEGLNRKVNYNKQSALKNLKKVANRADLFAGDKFAILADKLQRKKNKFEDLCNTVSANRYAIWKSVKGSLRDNQFKMIGNISANMGFAAWTSYAAGAAVAAGSSAIAPVVVPALAAYAVYHAAGSFVYPIIAEMRKINREKRELGKPTLGFKAALKQAWKNKTTDPKAKRTYFINAAVNTTLAVAGFAWLKRGIDAADAAKDLALGTAKGLNMTIAENIASTRHAVSLGRSGMASIAQLSDAAVTGTLSMYNPEDKKLKEDAKHTALAALAGLGFNVVAQFAFGHSGNSAGSVVDSPKGLSGADSSDLYPSSSQTSLADSTINKGIFSRFFSHRDSSDIRHGPLSLSSEPADTIHLGDKADSLSSAGHQPAGDTTFQPVSQANNPSLEDGLFPDKYHSKMGISERQFNTLVNTTEGTLKAATGEEITLNRAYANLDGIMDQFPGKTKEEVLYKFNRLYAFMRKAYEVGDGTLRETPSGREYLANRFSSLTIETLEKDKINDLVDFASANTYASKEDLAQGLNKMFPEGLSKKDMSSLIMTIHSNQRFYQHASEMEALINALGCGDKAALIAQGKEINALLDHTDSLLATGKEKTFLTGLSLAKDCHDDDGQWNRIAQKVVTPRSPDKPVEVPLIRQDLQLIPHDAKINTDYAFDEETGTIEPVKITPPYTPEPQETPLPDTPPVPEEVTKVRKVVTHNYFDLESGKGDKQEVVSSRKAARLLRRLGRTQE